MKIEQEMDRKRKEKARKPKVPAVVSASTKANKILKKSLKALSITKVDKTSLKYKAKLVDSSDESEMDEEMNAEQNE